MKILVTFMQSWRAKATKRLFNLTQELSNNRNKLSLINQLISISSHSSFKPELAEKLKVTEHLKLATAEKEKRISAAKVLTKTPEPSNIKKLIKVNAPATTPPADTLSARANNEP